MLRKSLSITIGIAFLSVLLMSFWQYCGPHDAKSSAKEHFQIPKGIHLKKVHHTCPSLDDANVVPEIRVFHATKLESSVKQSQPLFLGFAEIHLLYADVSSLPAINSPPHNVPLFLLIQVLRV